MEYDIMKSNLINNGSKNSSPSAIYIVGQTGSGKTSLIQKKMNEEGYIVIDNDLWRGYYPNYKEIVSKYKTDEIPEIMETMKEWRSKIIKELSDEHYNLLIHTSATNPEEVIKQISELKEKGYDISMIAIACNQYISKIRCCLRYISNIIRQRLW